MKPTKKRGRPAKQQLQSMPKEAVQSVASYMTTWDRYKDVHYASTEPEPNNHDLYMRRLSFLYRSAKLGYIIEVVALLIATAALLWTALT